MNTAHATTWFLAMGIAAWGGKAAFVGVFAVLVVILASLSPRLGGEAEGPVPWWRNVRLWAILVALVQIAVYAWWG